MTNLLGTDPFHPPATAPPVPDVVALSNEQTAHLLTRAFEMLACTLAVQYGEVDDAAARAAGLTPAVTIDIVTRAVVYGTQLVASTSSRGERLAEIWERDWDRALSPFTQGYRYQAATDD
jgi:hypothetical protein